MKQPDEIVRELVAQWIAKAEEDLGLATHLVAEDAPWRSAVGFHSQQAAEKFMKAFLVRHQVEFPKTHALGELLDLIAKVDEPLADSLRGTTALNPYGVAVRYPSEEPEPTADEAKVAVSLAKKVRDAILGWLGNYLGGAPHSP